MLGGLWKRFLSWRRLRLFKRIIIELSGPICTCPERDLAWSIRDDIKAGKVYRGLNITCKTCGTELQVSNDKFVAGWKLDTPYPGKPPAPKKDPPPPEMPIIVLV